MIRGKPGQATTRELKTLARIFKLPTEFGLLWRNKIPIRLTVSVPTQFDVLAIILISYRDSVLMKVIVKIGDRSDFHTIKAKTTLLGGKSKCT